MPPLIENYEGSYSMWSTAGSGRRDRVRAVGHGPRVPRHREVAHGIRVAPDRCSVDVEIHDAHAVVVGRSGLQQTEPWTVAPWFGLVNVTLGGASEAVTLTSNNIPSFSVGCCRCRPSDQRSTDRSGRTRRSQGRTPGRHVAQAGELREIDRLHQRTALRDLEDPGRLARAQEQGAPGRVGGQTLEIAPVLRDVEGVGASLRRCRC